MAPCLASSTSLWLRLRCPFGAFTTLHPLLLIWCPEWECRAFGCLTYVTFIIAEAIERFCRRISCLHVRVLGGTQIVGPESSAWRGLLMVPQALGIARVRDLR